MVGNTRDNLAKKVHSLAGKKAVATRKERERHEIQVGRGHKARRTVYSSELAYIDELAKTKGLDKSDIFHHQGLPDLIAIAPSRKLIFCEIKPMKGPKKRTMLSPQQLETIRRLLKKREYVEEVTLVRYTISRRTPIYGKPIQLTPQNIKEFTF